MSSQTFTLVRSGQLPALHAHLERELTAGKRLRITVSHAPSRSQEQNAYLHIAIRDLAQHLGQGETELKEYLKTEFGPTEFVQVGNRTGTIKKSFAKYSREEAGEMIEHVMRLAAECGLLLEPRGLL